MGALLALITGSLWGVMILTGQQAAEQDPAVRFKSGVQMLEVDARIFDKQGRFVTDLSAAEFEVLENGVPQKIEAVFLVGGASPVGAASDGARLTGRPAAPQTWIFIFDHRHIRPNGFKRAKDALEAFLSGRFRAGDLAGIVTHDRMINNRISSVRAEFLGSLAQVQMSGDAVFREASVAEAAASGGAGEAGENIRAALSAQALAEVRRDARSTLEMLEELAKGLARMPGPKTVVLLSDGFGMTDLEGTLRTVVGRMNRAGARIYAIDTRGLAGPPTDTINSLAVDTGGMVIFNENRIHRALDEIAADTNVYYVLGYYPNAKYDGKYRQIEVRVRRRDVRIRARNGYLALEPSRMLVPQEIK